MLRIRIDVPDFSDFSSDFLKTSHTIMYGEYN